LGPYEIGAAIGAGGMGEVYKARDTRLDRAVAIKVLPESLASDPQFRERFDREARAISQLSHPHICTLYDVGEDAGTAFLVMEYLEGETLEQRLKKRAVPLDEALQIAIQIADALSVAHRRGIIHRDLKPGNVMLTKSGAKLLDFGLAKSSGGDGSAAGLSMLPTTPANLTAQGAILGTFQYMAPEQLEGQDADARSDVFAFGALLYELVSGRKAFEGRSRASLIAAILEHDPPPLASLQPLAPASLDHIVAKCLAKNPDDRWQSARDVTTELKWLVSRNETRPAPTPPAAGRSTRAVRAPIVVAVAVAIGFAAVASAVVVKQLSDGSSREVVRSIVTTVPADHLLALPTDATTNEGRPSRTSMAWSPDAQSIVFSASMGGRQQLYVRALNQLEAMPIAGTEGASNPFFSPDGQWIGFAAERALRKVAVSGGPATTIVVVPGTMWMYGASWGDDGSIVYALERGGLWRVSAAGGTPERLTKPDMKKGELSHLLPQVLPGSRAVLFTVTHTPFPKWDDTEVVVHELATGSRRVLLKAAADGRYVASGHVVYLQRGTLMAAPFDLGSLKATGEGISVVAGVMQSANTTNAMFDSGAGQFAISAGGSLLYVPGGIFPDPERAVVWVSRTGAEEPLTMPVRAYASPRLSPDGTRVTLWTQGDRNVWIYDLARRSLTRVNVDGRNARGIWAPDGNRIAFSSTVGGPEENVYVVSADGSGSPDRLVTCDCQSAAASWTPDGRAIVSVEWNETNYDIVLIDVAEGHRRTPLLHGKAEEQYPDISPDGRWIAYVSNESGKNEVYVQPFPDLGPRHQISTDGGTAPAWSRDGRELFYTTTETFGGQATLTRMMAVAVATAPRFAASTPRILFEGRYGATGMVRPYDVSLDGQRFLMVKQKDRAPVYASQMILVQNWLEELKRRVPK
jgi:serine/threonine-protein kinase